MSQSVESLRETIRAVLEEHRSTAMHYAADGVSMHHTVEHTEELLQAFALFLEGIEWPEKCMGKQLNITVQSTTYPTISPKELIKNRSLQGEGWDMAIRECQAKVNALVEGLRDEK